MPPDTATAGRAHDRTTGARFAEARKLLGWSLRDAERASGIPNAHISQIETGTIANPRYAVVAKLASAYGMKIPVPPEAAAAARAEREQIKRLARDCGATGRGSEGTAVPFDELIDRYFAEEEGTDAQ